MQICPKKILLYSVCRLIAPNRSSAHDKADLSMKDIHLKGAAGMFCAGLVDL